MHSMWEMIKMMRAAQIIAVLVVLIAPWMLDLSKSSSVAADSAIKVPADLTKDSAVFTQDCPSDHAELVSVVSGRDIRRQRFFDHNREDWQWARSGGWSRDEPNQRSDRWELARVLFHVIFDPNRQMLSEAIRQINTRLMLSSLSNG